MKCSIKQVRLQSRVPTEKSAQEQFVDAKFHVVGGSDDATGELMQIYDIFSLCSTREFYRMSAHEPSFVKYGINTYLATKVTFFNQFYDLVNSYQCSYNIITRAMGQIVVLVSDTHVCPCL